MTTQAARAAMTREELDALSARLGVRPVRGGSDGGDGAGDDADGAGGGDGQGAGGDGDASAAGDGERSGDDLSTLRATLAKERESRRAAEKQLRVIERRIAEIENAGKSEAEKLAAERDRLQEQVSALVARQMEIEGREAIRHAARRLGAPDGKIDLIYRSVRGDLQYDDEGEPENAEQLVADLKELYPDLFRAPAGKADAGAGSKEPPKENVNAWLRRLAGYA